MNPTRLLTIAALAFAVAASAAAQGYAYQLQVRTQAAGTNFNIANGYSINSATAALNDSGRVAVKAVNSSGNGMWLGTAAGGSVIYTNPDTISDPTLSNSGRVVWTNLSTSPGIYSYDPVAGSSNLLTAGPGGAGSISTPVINNSGHVGFRATVSGSQGFYSYDIAAGTFATHATQNAASGPFTFLYTPNLNDSRQIAGKVATSADQFSATEIRRFNADGTSTLIAQDNGALASSMFDTFGNSVGFNNAGAVAFVANLVGGGSGVYLSDGVSLTTIATTAATDVKTIDAFAPALNDGGMVAFRGVADDNKRAIWVGNGTTLTRLVTEGDLLPTDFGTSALKLLGSSGSPFSGGLDINASGQVAFSAVLADTSLTVNHGLGVFVATPVPEPATLGALGLGVAALLRRRKRA